MKGETNNFRVERWTDNPAQREEFWTEVTPRIDGESNYMAGIYGVRMYHEDIASAIQAELLQQMLEIDTDGPFAKDSPKEAADFLLESYRIRERARSLARKEARKQSRQAEILADVRQPDLPQDIQTQLLAIAKSLPRIDSEMPNLTSRESEIFRKEVLRRAGIEDLPAPIFDQVAQAAGISSPEQRAHNKDHEQQGHLSASDRKAWSRARAKVSKAFTRAKLALLLVIVFALSLALYSGIHQKALAIQSNGIHQKALAIQSRDIHQKALARQVGLVATNRDPRG